MTSGLHEVLERIVGPSGVVTDPEGLSVYESDGFTIARGSPGAVVFPRTTAEVREIVRNLAAWGVQIVPRGSGTGLTGGCVAFEGGVVVSTARMNRILRIDAENRAAHVEAGVRNVQLSEAVAQVPGAEHLHFSPDPSSQRASTIGGNAATNAGGIHILKDFATSNHVLGLELVLANGNVVEVGASGGSAEAPYDLPGPFCGSEGTLGIITRLWVRLVPRPTAFRTIVSLYRDRGGACDTVSSVISEGHLPAAMEMLDGQMVRVIEDAYHFGFPPDTEALILCEIDGIEPLLDSQADAIAQIMRANGGHGIVTSGDPAVRAKLWKARKAAFGAIGRISPSYCTQDACVPRSRLREVLDRIDQIGASFGLRINNVFHAGDGNIHPIFLYDDRNPEQVRTTLRAAEEVLKYCIDIGGTLSGEHGVGVEKLHLMPYQFDEATMRQFRQVKAALDPGEVINAGKLVPSDRLVVDLLAPGRKVPQ
jgi:glycolate oxidase